MTDDPKGRYIGLIESPPFAVPDGEGWWILASDGSVYFGHALPRPETGFGILSQHATAPQVLLEALASAVDAVYGEIEDEVGLEVLPEVLLAGLGGTLDEAEEMAEAILEDADHMGVCPWRLAAYMISGYDPFVESESESPLPPQPQEPRGDAKIIPFPLERTRREA